MDFAAAFSAERRADRAADDLIAAFTPAFPVRPPKALVVFAGGDMARRDLLHRLARFAPGARLVGASSAGEFAGARHGHGQVSALAIGGDDVEVGAGIGRGLAGDPVGAARAVVAGFARTDDPRRPHRAALVLADALGGRMDEFVHGVTLATGGGHKVFGGGAGDDAAFRETAVTYGTEVVTDAAVALEIRSRHPIGIGAAHGWVPATPPFRVTAAEGRRLVSLDGLPALVAFEDHAEATGQAFDRAAPMPFFLHNILGVEVGHRHRLRVPLAIGRDGAVTCAAEIPTGALVSIMRGDVEDAVTAARHATAAALSDLGSRPAAGALMFDCVATRLRLGGRAAGEVDAVRRLLPDVPLGGCYTHGQVVRDLGQFATFQNCNAVVCLMPS